MSRKSDAMLQLMASRERNSLDAERRDKKRAQFQRLAKRAAWQDTVAVADGLFPTPRPIAEQMACRLHLNPGDTVLEPSAGTGRLLDAVLARQPLASLTAAEQCPRLQRHIYENYPDVALRTGDFLGMSFVNQFHAVIMNPPFRRGTDVVHILHALSQLRPGGKLVAICYDGVQQRLKLQPRCTTWTPLPAGSFTCEGTHAAVVLITIVK